MGAPFKLSNLVHQTSTTTGTGNFTLATVSGKQTFDQAYGHGATTDVFEYFIASQSNAEWEHGTGHMSSSTVLVRDTVWDSSNAGSLVSFSAATMDVTSAIGALGLWCPRGYIDGLTLSNDGGTPNTKLDVSAGICRDDTDAMAIRLTSSVVIDCTTTGPNGLDAGSLGVSTWYYVFAIGKRDGSAQAALASTSATAPTLPAGYQYQRRIGAFKTDGSFHILAFSQNGDEFIWGIAVNDVNDATLGTTAKTYTLNSVPTGFKVNALINVGSDTASTSYSLAVFSPDLATTTVNSPLGNANQSNPSPAAANAFGQMNVRTNTSAQIKAVSNVASTTIQVATWGWIDQRGKNK